MYLSSKTFFNYLRNEMFNYKCLNKICAYALRAVNVTEYIKIITLSVALAMKGCPPVTFSLACICIR